MLKLAPKRVQKITSRGQITLPMAWRNRVKADAITVRENGKILEIEALDLTAKSSPSEYTVFDAIRDNKGKGLKAGDLLKVLRKIDN